MAEKQPEKSKWELAQLPREFDEVVHNTETDEALTTNQAIVQILNELHEIRQLLGAK